MRLPPPVLALGAAVAQRALTGGAQPATQTRRTVSMMTAVASLGLMGSALHQFRSSGTTVDPLHPERASALVTGGPFQITRNPMYVGLAGLLTAHAVLRGSATAVLPLAAFVAVMDRVQVPPEEAAMAELFGTEYAVYRERVPRWVGV